MSASRPGPESAGALLRKPVVQAMLAVTVIAQVVATQAKFPQEAGDVAAMDLAPVVVTPAADPATRDAWLARAVERESDRLASEYQQRGYRVTPQLAADQPRRAGATGSSRSWPSGWSARRARSATARRARWAPRG
jgi:hypothetical protein